MAIGPAPIPSVTLACGTSVKLGRLTPVARTPTPKLGRYLDAAATPPPATADYSARAMDALKRMYLNDRLGDCVIAGKYHLIGLWTGNDAGAPVQGTDKEVNATYRVFSPWGDRGCNIAQVLDYFQQTGLVAGGKTYKIDGYISVDWTNADEVKAAIYLFGGVTIGMNLPGAYESTDVWDVTRSRIVGGHDVEGVGYDADHVFISTWGKIVRMTWAAFTSRNWLDECYASLSPDWYGQDRMAPCGVDVAALKSDLDALGNGHLPPFSAGPPVIPSVA